MILQTIERTLPADTADEEFGTAEKEMRAELTREFPEGAIRVVIYPPGFFAEGDENYTMRATASEPEL